jgi:hypothetical protein
MIEWIQRHLAPALMLLGTSVALSAAEADDASDAIAEVVERVEAAHNIEAWWKTDVLVADITIRFGGNVAAQGTMAFETNGPRARFDFATGATAIFDGETCWMAPPDADVPRARFHVLTWAWFTAAPFKLSGTGTVLETYERSHEVGEPILFARQTFIAGEGDTPKDWYDIWIDPETNRLAAMGYIVTYGRSLEEAEEEPHAIVYGGYQSIDGVLISTEWTFTDYDAGGMLGETRLGSATLENVRFETAGDRFEVPEAAAEVPLPGS